MGPCMDELKLVALDKDDIEVVSAHVQDSLVKVSDIFWRPRERRFVMALNRFDWMSAAEMAKRRAAQPARSGVRRDGFAGRCRLTYFFRRRRYSPRSRVS
jgi:hypothetical protein